MKDEARFYDIEGVGRLPSVTTILSVISKPGLLAWQAKQGTLKALNIMERLKEMAPIVHEAIQKEFGAAFFKDGNAQAAEAADYGKQAHSAIERHLKGEPLPEMAPPAQRSFESFLQWQKTIDFRLIKAECVIHSKRFGYAGTCDAIAETSEGMTLFDWKTGNRTYPDHELQTVAYKYAAEEMAGHNIQNVTICRFGKNGIFDPKKDIHVVPPLTFPDCFDRFIDAKRLWEWQRESQRLEAA